MKLSGLTLTEEAVERLLNLLTTQEDVHFDVSIRVDAFPPDATEEEIKTLINKKLLPCLQGWLDNTDIPVRG